MPEPIYLDHNATTPVFPEVIEAMRACWAEPYLNPASQHSFGRAARRMLEDARDRIGELLGAAPKTGSSSQAEARKRTISPFADSGGDVKHRVVPRPRRHQLIISSIEHPSVARGSPTKSRDQVQRLTSTNDLGSVSRTAVDTDGVVSLVDLAHCIGPSDARGRDNVGQQRNRRDPTYRRFRRDLQPAQGPAACRRRASRWQIAPRFSANWVRRQCRWRPINSAGR